MASPREFSRQEQLKNGLTVTMRAVRPDDKHRFTKAFKALEPETIYTRFFHHKGELTEADLRAATEVDFVHEVALVVTLEADGDEVILGSGRYFVLDDPAASPCRAEVSFTVEEDYHGQGIATRLLRELAALARDQGVTEFVAEVLRGNLAMLAVFEHSGLPMRTGASTEGIHVSLSLTD